jgi:hypothetical protein
MPLDSIGRTSIAVDITPGWLERLRRAVNGALQEGNERRPIDAVVGSPPFTGRSDRPSALDGFDRPWLPQIGWLAEVLSPTHGFIESRGLILAIPRRFPAILAGHLSISEREEAYPEVFVFGSHADYEKVVHETAAGAETFEPPKAFAKLRVADWSGYLVGSSSVRYRVFKDKAAVKLGRAVVDAMGEMSGLPVVWAQPRKPIFTSTKDGGQDGLFKFGSQPIWIQVTGGDKPDILPSNKSPNQAAAHFFQPTGTSSSIIKTKSAGLRLEIFGDNVPALLDIIHLAIGKAAPVAMLRSEVRGVAREWVEEGRREPRVLRTVTVHPLVLDPFVGSVRSAPIARHRP